MVFFHLSDDFVDRDLIDVVSILSLSLSLSQLESGGRRRRRRRRRVSKILTVCK